MGLALQGRFAVDENHAYKSFPGCAAPGHPGALQALHPGHNHAQVHL